MKIGDKVWVQLNPYKYDWTPGILIAEEGLDRRVQLAGEPGGEVVVRYNRVARWSNTSVRRIATPPPPPREVELTKNELEEWLKGVEVALGVTIPIQNYANAEKRLAVVAALLSSGQFGELPSWKEMALIGDALWLIYLRTTFIRRGHRNGKATGLTNNMVSRSKLNKVGQVLGLRAFVPRVNGSRCPSHMGELAEAFLGWAYTFGGESAYLILAEKYLKILEGAPANVGALYYL